jgi:omega-6 fatty acid desaturase (delta-12 desaturase)
VRAFIISHDCGHGSFTASKELNDRIGFWTASIAYTPYLQWRRSHAIHHADSGNVESDGTGYIWCQTTRQYQASSFLRRLTYRMYRSPLVLLGLGGAWLFLIEYRWFDRHADQRARRQVWAVNALWLAFAALIWLTLGPMALVKVQLPIRADRARRWESGCFTSSNTTIRTPTSAAKESGTSPALPWKAARF